MLLCKVKMIFYPNFHSLKYGLKWLEFGLYSYFLSSCIKNGHPLFLDSKCIIHSPHKVSKSSKLWNLNLYRASYWQQKASGRGLNKGSELLILRATGYGPLESLHSPNFKYLVQNWELQSSLLTISPLHFNISFTPLIAQSVEPGLAITNKLNSFHFISKKCMEAKT